MGSDHVRVAPLTVLLLFLRIGLFPLVFRLVFGHHRHPRTTPPEKLPARSSLGPPPTVPADKGVATSRVLPQALITGNWISVTWRGESWSAWWASSKCRYSSQNGPAR